MRSSAGFNETGHMPRPMLYALADRWWLFLMRGIAALVFGILALIWPGVTLVTLVLLYGVFALIDGAIAIVGAIRGSEDSSRWWLAIVGLVSIAAGAFALLWPGISSLVFVLCVAVWSIAIGLMQIVGAISMRHEIDDGWLLVASGALSVIFGGLLLSRPGAGAVALVFVIAAYAIAYGIMLILLAFRLRKQVALSSSR